MDYQAEHEKIAKEYDFDEHGTIRDPGPYEGEPWWIVMVDEWGIGDDTLYENDSAIECFEADDEMRVAFELAPHTAWITLDCSDQGFLHVAEWTTDEYDALTADLAADMEENDET